MELPDPHAGPGRVRVAVRAADVWGCEARTRAHPPRAYQGRQVTGEAGRTFEPTRHGTAEYGFVLYRQTAHLGA